MGDFGCKDHSQAAGGHHIHPDFDSKESNVGYPGDHRRSAAHPKRHTRGKLPSQLNPDHGPHAGAGKQR